MRRRFTRIRNRIRTRIVAGAVVVLGVVAVVPPAGATSLFTFYPAPTPASGPCVTSPGPDGAAWFVETIANKIGRIDVASGHVDEFPIPWTRAEIPSVNNGLLTPLPCAIQPGADGKMYFTVGVRNQIGSIDPRTKRFAMYDDPGRLGNLDPFNDITPGPDNAMWFTQTTAGKVGRFDLSTHDFADYTIPTPLSLPVGIYGASDGGVWFTEGAGNKIGRIDVATKRITEYPVPTPAAVPWVIRAQTGDDIWFAEYGGNKIASVNVATKAITEHPIPTPASLPVAVCAAQNGDIYFSHFAVNSIGRLDRRTGVIDETAIPGDPAAVSAEIGCGPGNAVWFVQLAANRVGRLSLD